jgi:ABC-type nickel/cobalt efflux system permease component RcnA
MFRLNEPAVSTEKTVPLFPWKKWMAAASITIIAGLGTYALWNQKENEKPVVAKVKMTTEDKKTEQFQIRKTNGKLKKQ